MSADAPYRLNEVERRLERIERRIDAMKFDAVLVRVDEAREDIKALNVRFGRLVWLLVTTMASLATGVVIVALTWGHA